MRIRTRIILCFAFLISIGLFYLFHFFIEDLKPQYRKSTEDPLIESAHVLASLAAISMRNGKIDTDLFQRTFEQVYQDRFNATIYDFAKETVDMHVYITDRNGLVIFDSKDSREVGKDYSAWRDVYLTLRGEYGARTTHPNKEGINSSIMYTAAPILKEGDIVGVLSVGKSTTNANNFVDKASRRIIIATFITLAISVLAAILLSFMLTIPISRLSRYARDVRDGKRASLPPLGCSEIAALGASFEEMREVLEGKKYIENYVQTFTHEIKSPLAALQGAIEILQENPAPEQRDRFLGNMASEVQRIKDIVDRMLVLATVEARVSLTDIETICANELIAEIHESFLPLIEIKKIQFRVSGSKDTCFLGERFLIRQAIANVVQNAIQFCPQDGQISITIIKEPQIVGLSVEDSGPGIPDYALSRVFERFYSLPRPDTCKKSSGLGLNLVREVLDLHGGSVSISSSELGGARVLLKFPCT